MPLKNNKSKIGVILFANLINVLGFSIVIPVMPFYVESMGLNPIVITSLFSLFAFCSFLSAPYLGSMSEKYGRKPILLLSILSSFVGWVVFALAKSPMFLFLGRAIDGLAAGNFTIMQNVIGDIATDRKERVKYFGMFGATFGIGFIIGPALGGVLSRISLSLPFYVVAALSFLSLLITAYFLPESHKHMDRSRRLDVNPLAPTLRVLKDKKVQPVMLVWFLFMMALGGIQAIGSLYLKNKYGFDATGISIIMISTSVLMIANQMIGMKIWIHERRERFVEKAFIFFLSFAYLFLTLHWLVAIVGLFVQVIAEGTLRALLSDRMFADVGPQERGELVGVQGSVMSIASAIAASAAGYLFIINNNYPFYMSAGFILIAAFLALRFKGRTYNPAPDMA